MGDRLCPLDEAQRLWALLTAAERVRFLSWVTTAPGIAREINQAPKGATKERE